MSPHEFLDTLGYWLCHQDPARTLSFGPMHMPLCIRCTGLYLFMGLAMWCGLLAPRSKRSLALLGLSAAAALGGSGLLFGQWLGAQMGFWHSNVANRLLTGFASGSGLGWLLHQAFFMRFGSESQDPPSLTRRLLSPALFTLLSGVLLTLLFTEPGWPLVGWVLGAASLAGFFTASGWGIAVVLSYALRGQDGQPRRVAIATVTLAMLIVQAVLMMTVRL